MAAVSVGELVATLRLKDEMSSALSTAQSNLTKVGTQMEAIGGQLRQFGTTLSIGLSAPLAAAGGAAFKFAGDFEGVMTRVGNLTSIGVEGMGEMSTAILELAPKVGVGPQALAEGLVVVASTGLQGAEALAVLESASRASAIGLGETNDIARVVTAAMTAYGKENITASEATNMLFVAAREGGAEASEFAGTLGTVIGVAEQMGVEFEEVLGSVAQFTRLGVDAATATTGLRASMLALLNPGKEARDVMEQYGTSAEEVRRKIREEGLLVALDDLMTRTGGNIDAFAQIIPESRALASVFGTVGRATEATAETIRKIKTDTEASDAAFDVVSQTLNFKLNAALSKGQELLIKFGGALAPAFEAAFDAIDPLVEKLGQVVEWFSKLPEPVRNTAAAFGAMAIAIGPIVMTLGIMTSGIGQLIGISVKAASPILALGKAIAGIAGDVKPAVKATDALIDGMSAAGLAAKGSGGLFTGLLNIFKGTPAATAPVVVASKDIVAGMSAAGNAALLAGGNLTKLGGPATTSIITGMSAAGKAAAAAGGSLTSLGSIAATVAGIGGLGAIAAVLAGAAGLLALVALMTGGWEDLKAALGNSVGLFGTIGGTIKEFGGLIGDVANIFLKGLSAALEGVGIDFQQFKGLLGSLNPFAIINGQIQDSIAAWQRLREWIGYARAAITDFAAEMAPTRDKLSQLAREQMATATGGGAKLKENLDELNAALRTANADMGVIAGDGLPGLKTGSENAGGAVKGLTEEQKKLQEKLIEARGTFEAINPWINTLDESTGIWSKTVRDVAPPLMEMTEQTKKAEEGLRAQILIADDAVTHYDSMITGGIAPTIQSMGDLTIAYDENGVSLVKVGEEILLSNERTGQWQDSLGGLAQSMSNLSQIAGGTFGAITQSIATVIGSMAAAHEGNLVLKGGLEALAAGGKGSVMEGLSGIAAGGLQIFSSFMQATEGAGKLEGAAKGAALGFSVGGPWGAAIGGLAGLIRGFFNDAEKQINPFRQSFVDAAGGLDVLAERARLAGTDVRALLDAKNPEQFKKATDDLTLAFETQDAAMQTLRDTAERYGFTIQELGPAFASQQLSEQAQQLYQDYQVLIAGGVDVEAVTRRMGEATNDYVQKAVSMGMEIPSAMRPMIEKMMEMGQLTDENGMAITDLQGSGITFSSTMTQGFQSVVTAVETLTTAIARGLGLSLDTVLPKAKEGTDTFGGAVYDATNDIYGMGAALNGLPIDTVLPNARQLAYSFGDAVMDGTADINGMTSALWNVPANQVFDGARSYTNGFVGAVLDGTTKTQNLGYAISSLPAVGTFGNATSSVYGFSSSLMNATGNAWSLYNAVNAIPNDVTINVDYNMGAMPTGVVSNEAWEPVMGAIEASMLGFAGGTKGQYLDFGAGTPVMLHGQERIMTKEEAEGGGSNLDVVREIHALRMMLSTLPDMLIRSQRDAALLVSAGRR